MAEEVQAVLDQMVTPLRDLMDRGVFSETEIRAIVSRRRDSEYLLRRRAARKADFLRYIKAEMTLEKLRQIRTRQVLARQARSLNNKKQQQSQDKKKKSHIGDSHIVSHVHFLFIRLLRKFRSDVSLHLQHAAFAKESKSYTRLGRIYAEALQVHPRNVGLWIEAASHEYFGHEDEKGQRVGGGSVQSARVLLQRGLRVNQTSQDLWLQYFSLEFHHIQKLRGRREILQMADNNDGNDEPPADETDPLFHEAPIPTLVYKNAIKAIPDDVTFRLKFLELLKLFPQTDAVEAFIMTSIREDFKDKPEAWIARATFAIEQTTKQGREEEDTVGFAAQPEATDESDEEEQPRKKQKRDSRSARDPVITVLQEASNEIHTAEMYLQCIQFARNYVNQLAQGGIYGEEAVVARSSDEANVFINGLLRKAQDDGVRSANLVMEHVDILVSSGQLEDATKLLEEFILKEQHETATTLLWINWARLAQQLDPPRPAVDVLQMALKRIQIHDKGHMVILLELFAALLRQEPSDKSAKPKRDKELADLYQRILLLSPGEDYRLEQDGKDGAVESDLADTSVADICLQYLLYSMQENGVSATRNTYEELFRSSYCQSPAGKSQDDLATMKEIFDKSIRFEKQKCEKSEKGRKQLKKQLMRIYDVAISFFEEAEPAVVDTYQQGRDEEVRFF